MELTQKLRKRSVEVFNVAQKKGKAVLKVLLTKPVDTPPAVRTWLYDEPSVNSTNESASVANKHSNTSRRMLDSLEKFYTELLAYEAYGFSINLEDEKQINYLKKKFGFIKGRPFISPEPIIDKDDLGRAAFLAQLNRTTADFFERKGCQWSNKNTVTQICNIAERLITGLVKEETKNWPKMLENID